MRNYKQLLAIWLACVGICVEIWTLFGRIPPPLDISAALSVEEDLSEAAGLGQTDHRLIEFLQKLQLSPQDQATLKFRLCGLVWSESGPAQALPYCEESLAQLDQPRTRYRISRLHAELHQPDQAFAILQGLPEPKEPVSAAYWGWAWGYAHMANLSPTHALLAFQRVAQVLPSESEYQAIADLEIAKVYLSMGNYQDGYRHLNQAIWRQQTLMLDPDKGGYSEYQLYLARMLVLHPDYKTEGERLFQTLRTVDPNRYEYTH